MPLVDSDVVKSTAAKNNCIVMVMQPGQKSVLHLNTLRSFRYIVCGLGWVGGWVGGVGRVGWGGVEQCVSTFNHYYSQY